MIAMRNWSRLVELCPWALLRNKGEECQYGQLGAGNIPKSDKVTVHVIEDLSGVSFSQVSCGSFHTAVKKIFLRLRKN